CKMRLFTWLLSYLGIIQEEKLLFTQLLWRHGLRTPMDTYSNEPYNEKFFGVHQGELVEKGMEQHFIRGEQLRKMYIKKQSLVSAKYSRYETYVRSSDVPRCIQSALANMAGFYSGSPTFPRWIPHWPSAWTPVPVHTVALDEDYILQSFDVCKKYMKLKEDRQQRKEFKDFVASKGRLLKTINEHTGDPADFSFMAILGMCQSLQIEKSLNLKLPKWVTPKFYSELEETCFAGNDYIMGAAGFGLPMDSEMVKMVAGFLFKEWMDNIDAVINGTSKLKYYAYSGNDKLMNPILFGLGVKDFLIGTKNSDYASTIVWEIWEKEKQHFIKSIFYHYDTK
ncbi:hypothetical protein PMAYCL1PPCAC_07986, partial [Pristionchus mayeri]